MHASMKLAGFELIVPDIDAALALFVDGLGLELVERRSSTDPAGEVAVVAAGDAAISLLQPSDAGPGYVMPNREARLSQIVFSVEAGRALDLATNIAERGLTARQIDEAQFFVTPAATEGLIGLATAIVVTGEDDDQPSEPS